MKQKAVFLDRDGTLMVEVDYCADPSKVKLLPGVVEGLRALKTAGYLLIIVTNQSGIGRGYFTESDYAAVHAELLSQIGPSLIDATYYCPEAPGTPSTRRKPKPGMVLEAAQEHGIDLATSWFIGDKQVDLECGHRAGTKAILVRTGHGKQEEANGASHAERVVDDFAAAVQTILSPSLSEAEGGENPA